jgi:hypothetical protein
VDQILGSANTIIGLVIAFASACIWLGKMYASHKALENKVEELTGKLEDLNDKFNELDKKLDQVISILSDKVRLLRETKGRS